jgi:cobalamin synthase
MENFLNKITADPWYFIVVPLLLGIAANFLYQAGSYLLSQSSRRFVTYFSWRSAKGYLRIHGWNKKRSLIFHYIRSWFVITLFSVQYLTVAGINLFYKSQNKPYETFGDSANMISYATIGFLSCVLFGLIMILMSHLKMEIYISQVIGKAPGLGIDKRFDAFLRQHYSDEVIGDLKLPKLAEGKTAEVLER